MKTLLRYSVVAALILCVSMAAVAQDKAQDKKPGVLSGADLKLVVPTNYFFDDQVAPVQARNAVAIRAKDGKVVTAGLVDTSGYSTDVAQKYQGYLITSKKITIEGQALNPGQYGFGFGADGKFRVMDVGAGDVFTADFHTDDKLARPVPFKAVANGDDYRLYAGKKYVTVSVQ
jgi:hypothetical protein